MEFPQNLNPYTPVEQAGFKEIESADAFTENWKCCCCCWSRARTDFSEFQATSESPRISSSLDLWYTMLMFGLVQHHGELGAAYRCHLLHWSLGVRFYRQGGIGACKSHILGERTSEKAMRKAKIMVIEWCVSSRSPIKGSQESIRGSQAWYGVIIISFRRSARIDDIGASKGTQDKVLNFESHCLCPLA